MAEDKPSSLAKPDKDLLDAILIVSIVFIVGSGVFGLMFLDIPQDNLAILASLLSGLTGTVIGGYAGYRWGASMTDKHAPQAAGTASVTFQATADTAAVITPEDTGDTKDKSS